MLPAHIFMKRLLLIFILITSCQTDKTSEVKDVDSLTIDITEESDQWSTKSMANLGVMALDTARIYFVDNDIAANPFVEDFEGMINKVGQYNIQSKLHENQHNENEIDTVLTAIFDNSSITYFKGESEGFILSAKIRSDKIEFKRGIRVGMNKPDFLRLFQGFVDRPDPKDVIISDEDSLQSVNFKFENNQLKEIIFQAFFD
jgi:hypothetical protein